MEFDVITTALPRLTTQKCIGSFLSRCMDLCEHRLHWHFHLDQPPEYLEELKSQYHRNVSMAEQVGRQFASWNIYEAYGNVGYGASVLEMLEKVGRPAVLWLEDDKRWTDDFYLSRAVELLRPDTIVYWTQFDRELPAKPYQPGCTAPGLWPAEAVQYLRGHFPGNTRRVTERAICSVMEGWKVAMVDMLTFHFCDVARSRISVKQSPAQHYYEDGRFHLVNSNSKAIAACKENGVGS